MRLKQLSAVLAGGLLLAVPGFGSPNTQTTLAVRGVETPTVLEQHVRSELAKLPYFGVFDNLSFSVGANDQVTLSGQVTRPTLKRDAENAVKHIEGVTAVDNQVEVLPLSPFDNQIRLNAYYAIFGTPSLNRYAIAAQPPIRIIVKNGHVTLEGVVNNELDRRLAYARVQGLPGAFDVTNHLRLDSGE